MKSRLSWTRRSGVSRVSTLAPLANALRARSPPHATQRQPHLRLDPGSRALRRNSFCLADSGGEDDAPWRLRTTVVTMRVVARTGPFQVQTIAAHPDKLNVKRELFEALLVQK